MNNSTDTEKLQALTRQAAETLLTYPVWSGKEKCKRFVKRLLGQKTAPQDPYAWPNALLAKGLVASSDMPWGEGALPALMTYFDRRQGDISRPDQATNGMPLLDLYEKTGKQEYADRAKRLAESLRNYPRTAEGTLPYNTNTPDLIFADTIGMICPFLCRYGSANNDADLVQLGINQMAQFFEHGFDAATGLPYHGYDTKIYEKQGCIGWGRAVGWIMMGLSESLPYLVKETTALSEDTDDLSKDVATAPDDTTDWSVLQDGWNKLVATVLPYQRADGGFSWLLQAKEGPADSSATAMIGTALALGVQTGTLQGQVRNDAEKALPGIRTFLLTHLQDGRIGQGLSECEGFGQYPQRYGNFPWCDGPGLQFFATLTLFGTR